MDIRQLTVEVRDKNLNRLGQIADVDLDLLVEDAYSNVGSWTLNLRSDHPLAGAICTPGAGIIVSDTAGNTIMSGPVTETDDKATIEDPGGTIQIDGLSDTLILADRLAYPDPTNTDPDTQGDTYDVRTGAAEDLMHAYVNANIGPSAPTARRITTLQMGTNGHRGSTLTKRARFDVLGNLLNDSATTSGLGFRVIQVASHLEFQTSVAVDHSADVRYDVYNNMLSGHSKQTAPPGVTRAIVAGDGTKLSRPFVEVTTTASLAGEALWSRRIEQFVDERSTTDPTELAQAGTQALTDAGFAQVGIQVVPMEDIGVGDYGNKYTLGDWVTVVVKGVQYSVQVTGYVFKKNSDGIKFGLVLGNPTAKSPTAQVTATVTKLADRVSNLERNSDSSPPTLAELTDAAISAPSTGQILRWNGTDWANATPAAPGATALSGLSDATVTSPAIGQLLQWNGTKWVNATPAVPALSTLSDATISSPANGQMLKYNGTKWVNSAAPAVSTLSDATIGTPVSGQLLQYNGAKWANTDPYVTQLAGNALTESAAITSYPLGISLMVIGSGSGWTPDGGFGTVVTYNLGTSRAWQEVHFNESADTWRRFYYDGDGGWNPWVQELANSTQGRGVMAYNQATSNSGTVNTTESSVLSLPSTLYPFGRAYKVTFGWAWQTATTGTAANFAFREGSATGTLLCDFGEEPTATVANATYKAGNTGIFVNSQTYNVTSGLQLTLKVNRPSSGATAFMPGTTARPRWAMVEDIGPSSKFSGALTLT